MELKMFNVMTEKKEHRPDSWGPNFRAPFKPPSVHNREHSIVLRGLRGPLIWGGEGPLCRETPVFWTANLSFSQAGFESVIAWRIFN